MNTPASFFWHDYETSGTNPRRDRPVQFAGIRTDTDFNIIGEPLRLYCQPTEDTLGHPEAALVTGITPQMAAQRGVAEPRFIAAIVEQMAVPNTCSVGYNSLRFDDEITRHTLWRNFFDPYAREWQNGCTRWDIIDMVRLTYALRPDGIEWPLRDDGAPSFKLEDLAAANGLAQATAHDALSDVQATIELAQLIRAQQPRLYDYVLGNRDKRSAAALLDLATHKPALHVSQKYPARLGCLSPVMPIAAHPSNKNAVIVYDLRADPAALFALSPADIQERMFTPTADLPEDAPRVALKSVHLNKCPVLAPVEMLHAGEAERLQLDMAACRRHWQAIHSDLEAVVGKVRAVFEHPSFEASADAETALYDGFVGREDRALADRVRASDGAQLGGPAFVFSDSRLNTLLFAYRARYYPDTLDDAEHERWRQWVANRLEYAPDGGLTLDEYDRIIEVLMQKAQGEPARLQILLDLKAWSDKLRNRV